VVGQRRGDSRQISDISNCPGEASTAAAAAEQQLVWNGTQTCTVCGTFQQARIVAIIVREVVLSKGCISRDGQLAARQHELKHLMV
jgi:hypothetical protein